MHCLSWLVVCICVAATWPRLRPRRNGRGKADRRACRCFGRAGRRQPGPFGAECESRRAGFDQGAGRGKCRRGWRSARALGSIGRDAASAVPTLTKHLGDKEPAMRTQCVAALGKIGVSDEMTITAMSKCVVDDEAHVQRAAIQALQRLKPDPKVIIPSLLTVMHDAQPDVAMSAMAALSDMGETAVPALVDSLSNKASRHWAAVVLAEIGPKASAAATPLAGLVKDPEPEVRMQALIALGQIGGTAVKPAIPAIIEATGLRASRPLWRRFRARQAAPRKPLMHSTS